MAKYPIKMLKDEEGNAFVPLTSSEALKTPDGKTLDEKLQNKLETTNIKAGTDINITVDGNNVTINNASKGVLIDNLTTETPGVGSLDAHQGKVLKDMIPEVVNNVTSTDSDKALSAYQGYLLSGKVVPTGGKEGQVLKKSSDTNWSLEWGDAADPNAIVGDGSIRKIVELTYEEYQALETIDPDTEYHIIDAQSAIDNLQATLDSLQEQINAINNKTELITGEVLYSNDNGTLDSLTFSKAINNTTYPYLKIFYRNNDKMLGCMDVYNPVGNRVNLVTSDVRSSGANAGRLYIKTSCFDITSTGMNNSSDTFNYGNFSIGSDSVINIDGSVKLIYITKVIAYKNI